jgi:hypothetical protein
MHLLAGGTDRGDGYGAGHRCQFDQEGRDAPRHTVFEPGRGIEGLRDSLEKPLKALMAMVGVLLVIACGNIAMLLTARNSVNTEDDLFRDLAYAFRLSGQDGRIRGALVPSATAAIFSSQDSRCHSSSPVS